MNNRFHVSLYLFVSQFPILLIEATLIYVAIISGTYGFIIGILLGIISLFTLRSFVLQWTKLYIVNEDHLVVQRFSNRRWEYMYKDLRQIMEMKHGIECSFIVDDHVFVLYLSRQIKGFKDLKDLLYKNLNNGYMDHIIFVE
jgi:hypothetical protein